MLPLAKTIPAEPPPHLPAFPPELRAAQEAEFAQLTPEAAAATRAFLDLVLRVRAEYGRANGWRDAQVGYLTIEVKRPARAFKGTMRKRYIYVTLWDRDLETGAAAGHNPRIFCYVDSATGDIFKVSTDGKAIPTVRGNILDLMSARRAITPFGIESR